MVVMMTYRERKQILQEDTGMVTRLSMYVDGLIFISFLKEGQGERV
jgi:hypothetical protein